MRPAGGCSGSAGVFIRGRVSTSKIGHLGYSRMKRLLKDLLGRFDLELRRTGVNFDPGIYKPQYIKKLCHPQTVIDVGVGYGTHELYEAFPNAHFILIEPVVEYRNAIENIKKMYKCEVHLNAAGDKEGVCDIFVDHGNPLLTSFSHRTKLTSTGNKIERRQVAVKTLDSIIGDRHPLPGPVVLKIDAEGHELFVLRGSAQLLQYTDYVVAEVSVAKRFEEGYEFDDMLIWMHEHDFRLFSILHIMHPEGELRTRFVDVVFARRESL